MTKNLKRSSSQPSTDSAPHNLQQPCSSIYSIISLKSPTEKSSRHRLFREHQSEKLRRPLRRRKASLFPSSFDLDAPAVSNDPAKLTYAKRTIVDDEPRQEIVETISPMVGKANFFHMVFKQNSSTAAKSVDPLNSDSRKRRYSDDNETSRATKLAHFTCEHDVSHHLMKTKSSDHMFVRCSDSVLQVFDNYSIESNTTECEPQVCSTSTMSSLKQFNVSLEQKTGVISNKFTIYNTPSCCEDLYGLEVELFVNHQQLRSKHGDANNRKCVEASVDDSRIITTYLSTESAALPSLQSYSNIIHFNNDCKCVSQILSTTDKFIYFVIPTFTGKYVIPLIHNHPCIEYIYIYTSDNESQPEWLSSYPKIRGTWSVIQQLETQLNIDMNSHSKRNAFQPVSWDSLFFEICSQNPNEKSLMHLLKDEKSEKVLETIVIATLKCKDLALSHPNPERILLKNFDDVTHCANFMLAESRTVFLIVSDTCNPSFDFQHFCRFDRLRAMYVWSETHAAYTSSIQNPNVRGTFTEVNGLLQRLAQDICFYRQAELQTFSFATFQPVNMSQLILPQLGDQQNNFLSIYLLSRILSQMPEVLDESVSDDENSLKDIKYLSRLTSRGRVSALLPDLLKLRRCISKLDNKQFACPQIVYHADIVSTVDLHILKKSCNQLFSSSTYIFTTKNLVSARTVSRHNANTGLNAVLFEIEITQSTKVFDFYEDNSLLFPVGTTFRIYSIDQAPDCVWYVKLIYTVEQDLQVVIEQIEYEVGQPLNWLTFGRFLHALKLVNEAKEYYNFWLRTLALDHPARSSIHYRLGIEHAALGEDPEAVNQMRQVLQSSQPIMNELENYNRQIGETEELSSSPFVDQSILFGNIADTHYIRGEHGEALEIYEKALETTTDQKYRRHFQKRLDMLKNMLRPSSSSNNYA